MKPQKVKVWLARDNDGIHRDETWIFLKKPYWRNETKQYFPIAGYTQCCAKALGHYGLKPGECIPATLVIGEEQHD
jgi:hypothetical protein